MSATVKDKKNLHHIAIDKTIITCPLCMKHYNEPKLLKCLHTVCKNCLVTLYEHGNRPKTLECPTCGEKTELGAGSTSEGGESAGVINKLQDNYYVRYMIKQVHDQRMEDLCETCHNTAATVKCTTCIVKLCGACADVHMRDKEMVHDFTFLMEDDVEKKDLGEIGHQNSSQASLESRKSNSEPMKQEEEKELPFEFYCDECKSKDCDHCANMKKVAQKNIVRSFEPQGEDPYPEPSHSMPVYTPTSSARRDEPSNEGRDKQSDEVSPRENDKEQDELTAAPAVTENTDSDAEDGKQNANGETDKLENMDEQQEKGEAENQPKTEVDDTKSKEGDTANPEDILNQSEDSIKSQGTQTSQPNTPRNPPPSPLDSPIETGSKRENLDNSYDSRDSERTLTPQPPEQEYYELNMDAPVGVGPPSHQWIDQQQPVTQYQQPMRRPFTSHQLQTVPEDEGMEGVAMYGRAPSPDFRKLQGEQQLQQQQQQRYQQQMHLNQFPQSELNNRMMPIAKVSASFGFNVLTSEQNPTFARYSSEEPVFNRPPQNWPVFEDKMSVSVEEDYTDEDEAEHYDYHPQSRKIDDADIRARAWQQQFQGQMHITPDSFPTRTFTVGTGTGPVAPRTRQQATYATSVGAKGRAVANSSAKTGSRTAAKRVQNDKPKGKLSKKAVVTTKAEVHTSNVQWSAGSNEQFEVIQGDNMAHTPYAQKLPRRQMPMPEKISLQKIPASFSQNDDEPRCSTPTGLELPPPNRARSGGGSAKPNRLAFNVQRNYTDVTEQPSGRPMVFPSLPRPGSSVTAPGGKLNLQHMETEYIPVEQSTMRFPPPNRGGGAPQLYHQEQRSSSAPVRVLRPSTTGMGAGVRPMTSLGVTSRRSQVPDDVISVDSELNLEMMDDPVLRQMEYEEKYIYEGDPVLRDMALHKPEPHPPSEYQTYRPHDNSVSMVSDCSSSNRSFDSGDGNEKKKVKRGTILRAKGTMYDDFVPIQFSELIREENDPISYQVDNTLQCISAMSVYEDFSADELRFLDYNNFDNHTKTLLKKNYSLVCSVLRSGFKLDTLPENRSLQQKFAKQEPDISNLSKISAGVNTSWQFDINGPAPGFRPASEASNHGSVQNGDQLNNSQTLQNQGDAIITPGITSQLPADMNQTTPKTSVAEDEEQQQTRPVSQASNKHPSRPGSRIGEAPMYDLPPSPGGNLEEEEEEETVLPPNSARQSVPNSARKYEAAGIDRTPTPEELCDAVRKSQEYESPFITTGSHPNSPRLVSPSASVMSIKAEVTELTSEKTPEANNAAKVTFTFAPMPKRTQVPSDTCPAFGLPEMFGGLNIWEKSCLFEATKQYIPTLLAAAKIYWSARGRPTYTSSIQMTTSVSFTTTSPSLDPKPLQTTEDLNTSSSSFQSNSTSKSSTKSSPMNTYQRKYDPPIICLRTKQTGTDFNAMTQITAISAMKCYEDSSFEELRLADYSSRGLVLKQGAGGTSLETLLEALLLKNAHERM